MISTPVNVFWFRRDLRLRDNVGLERAFAAGLPVLPVFIFDTDILDDLDDKADKRVAFIHECICEINSQLAQHASGLMVMHGKPVECFERLVKLHCVHTVFTNEDYEPYALRRDAAVQATLERLAVRFSKHRDHILFSPTEILKDDGTPYAVFSAYYKRWRGKLNEQRERLFSVASSLESSGITGLLLPRKAQMPSLNEIGFNSLDHGVSPFDLSAATLKRYALERDFPASGVSTFLSPHLRFGTVSVRKALAHALTGSEKLVVELAWREFFVSILFHHPHVVTNALKPDYEKIQWRNDPQEFTRWCHGETGYPLVDAGMRELNETGRLHNRVRMVVASFLVKHLLIDWRQGETYFAQKLLDYDLASNNGNWQWVAGCGADAAPYFRVFNPAEQAKRFDPKNEYIRKWVPEFESLTYRPMIDHASARNRALEVYKRALSKHRANPARQ